MQESKKRSFLILEKELKEAVNALSLWWAAEKLFKDTRLKIQRTTHLKKNFRRTTRKPLQLENIVKDINTHKRNPNKNPNQKKPTNMFP